MTKLLPKNNTQLIPKGFGGLSFILSGINIMKSYLKLNLLKKLNNRLLLSNSILANKSKRSYNPKIEKLLRQLYKIGAFDKNIPSNKAIDGIDGSRTLAAILRAKLMGYTVKGSDVTKDSSNFGSSIKKAWLKLTGTYKPTLEEYKESRRLEIRDKAALVNEQTITPSFPIMSQGPMKGHDMDVRGKKGWDDARIVKEFTKYIQLTEKYLKEHPNIEPLAKQRINETLSYYKKVAKNPKYIDKHGGGFGCIYTASGSYGKRWSNNKELADATLAGKDTGFEIIDPEGYKKGDIVQLGRSEKNNYPHHAEMVTNTFLGYPKLAQTLAEGYGPNDKENDWNNAIGLELAAIFGKNSGTGRFLQGSQIMRFVGTKAQNKLWEREYYLKYGRTNT